MFALKRIVCALACAGLLAAIAACNGGLSNRNPDTVIDHGTVHSVMASDFHTCTLWTSGDVRCWGENGASTSAHAGLLGDGDTVDRGDGLGEMGATLPFAMIGIKAVALSGGGLNTCAMSSDSEIRCWGTSGSKIITQAVADVQATYGSAIGDQIGDLGAQLAHLVLDVPGSVIGLSVGRVSACAVRSDGLLKCWGENTSGQLGQGNVSTYTSTATIATVDLGSAPVKQVSMSFLHGCALFGGIADGSIKCWGANDASFAGLDPSTYSGALGTGTAASRGDNPGEMGLNLPYVNLGTGILATKVVTGVFFSCALLQGGSVKCWGISPQGQTGQGVMSSTGYSPETVGAGIPVVDLGAGVTITDISAGSAHVCALTTDHRVKCWGGNANGQLGLGDTAARGDDFGEMGSFLPYVDLGTGFQAKQISAGLKHTCAVSTTGQVKCWGDNSSAQLGLGDRQNRGDDPGEMGDALPSVSLETN